MSEPSGDELSQSGPEEPFSQPTEAWAQCTLLVFKSCVLGWFAAAKAVAWKHKGKKKRQVHLRGWTRARWKYSRCGDARVPGIILWVIQVSPGLEHTCTEEPRITCRRSCWAGWLSLKPAERKSRISAGTRLPQVLLQHRKQDGRDKLHLSVCNKKKKP